MSIELVLQHLMILFYIFLWSITFKLNGNCFFYYYLFLFYCAVTCQIEAVPELNIDRALTGEWGRAVLPAGCLWDSTLSRCKCWGGRCRPRWTWLDGWTERPSSENNHTAVSVTFSKHSQTLWKARRGGRGVIYATRLEKNCQQFIRNVCSWNPAGYEWASVPGRRREPGGGAEVELDRPDVKDGGVSDGRGARSPAPHRLKLQAGRVTDGSPDTKLERQCPLFCSLQDACLPFGLHNLPCHTLEFGRGGT